MYGLSKLLYRLNYSHGERQLEWHKAKSKLNLHIQSLLDETLTILHAEDSKVVTIESHQLYNDKSPDEKREDEQKASWNLTFESSDDAKKFENALRTVIGNLPSHRSGAGV